MSTVLTYRTTDYSNLGLVDNSNKKIQPLGKYRSLFDFSKLSGKTTVLMANGSVYDTISLIGKVVKDNLQDTAQLAAALKGNTLEETLRNNWNWVYNHIAYELDKNGVEQIRRPLRLVSDLKGDCDCFTTFLSSLLHNQGISHTLRMTKYNGKNHYQHIYIIVNKPQGNGYYTLDCVLDQFDKEHPFTGKYDKKMNIELLGNLPRSRQSEQMCSQFVNGLGNAEPETFAEIETEFSQNVFETLLFRRKQLIAVNKAALGKDEKLKSQLSKIDLLLNNWGNVTERTRLLDVFAAQEEAEPLTEEEEEELYNTQLNGVEDEDEIENAWDELNYELNGTQDGLGLFGRRRKKKKGKKGGLFGRIGRGFKSITKGVGKGLKAAGKGIARGAKKALESTKKFAKKVGKALMKYNPATATIRNAVLLGMKINIFSIAGKLGFGLASERHAKSQGWDMTNYRKAKSAADKMIKTHVDLGGKKSSIIKNIKQGFARHHRIRKTGITLGTVGTLGAAATASTAAGGSIFAKFVLLLKKFGKVAIKGVKAVSKVFKSNPEKKAARQQRREERNAARDQRRSEQGENGNGGGLFNKAASFVSKTLMPNSGGINASYGNDQIDQYGTDQYGQDYDNGANQGRRGQGQGMSTPLMIGLGVGGAAIIGTGIFLATRQSNNRPVNGINKRSNTSKSNAKTKRSKQTTKISY